MISQLEVRHFEKIFLLRMDLSYNLLTLPGTSERHVLALITDLCRTPPVPSW